MRYFYAFSINPLTNTTHHHCTPNGTHYTPTVPLQYPDCTPAVSSLYPYCILAVSSLYPDCILTVSWLCPHCILTVSSLYNGCILAVSSLYPDCILTVSWLYPHCILTVSSLYPHCIPIIIPFIIEYMTNGYLRFFHPASYSIVKCSFVCLFVNALNPCKINIEKYTNVVLFLRFPAKY